MLVEVSGEIIRPVSGSTKPRALGLGPHTFFISNFGSIFAWDACVYLACEAFKPSSALLIDKLFFKANSSHSDKLMSSVLAS